ncbi:MAG: hypothetical protein QW279_09800 [Candidatus Jordarchaeaceae archaeon]
MDDVLPAKFNVIVYDGGWIPINAKILVQKPNDLPSLLKIEMLKNSRMNEAKY